MINHIRITEFQLEAHAKRWKDDQQASQPTAENEGSADSVVHDSADDRIYYLKNNILYEYSIKENNRFSLCKNVSEFSILGNKRGIICKDELGRIIMYMFKGKEIKVLSQEPYAEASYAVSQEGVLYSNGNKLYYCNYLGKIYTISENFNSSKPFYISENNGLCYSEHSYEVQK